MEWIVFVALNVMFESAFRLFVPAENRRVYAQCPKDGMYWTAILCFHSIWIVAALQQWFAFDWFALEIPHWHRIGGVFFFVVGQSLVVAARRVNPLFLPILAYVPPRLLVTRGVYALLDHPGYVGMWLAAWGVWLLLGEGCAIVPMAIYQGLLLRRWFVEDKLLSSQPSL